MLLINLKYTFKKLRDKMGNEYDFFLKVYAKKVKLQNNLFKRKIINSLSKNGKKTFISSKNVILLKSF